MSLSCWLGLHLYATNGAPCQTWVFLQPGRKVVTYLQEPPSKLRDSRDSVAAPTAKPDLGFSSLLGECHSVESTQGCQKCDRSWGWHRYTRWTGRLSHQTSDLSHPHNLLLKACDLCFARYQVQGDVGSELPS